MHPDLISIRRYLFVVYTYIFLAPLTGVILGYFKWEKSCAQVG